MSPKSATPIVVVQKPSGKSEDLRRLQSDGESVSTRTTASYSSNRGTLRHTTGGVQFSKLDMRDAYLQIELDDETKQLLVINTNKGLYRYNRLCFGPSPAPAISRNWWAIWLPAFKVSQLTLTTSSSLGRQRRNTSKTCDAF